MKIAMSIACQQVHQPLLGFQGGIGIKPFCRPKEKVVFILGVNSAGKSRLAIDLASRFPAEVIKADKMQVYRGLDNVTNEATPRKSMAVPHDPLGFVDPESDFTATDFGHITCRAIESIVCRDRPQIIAGGSNSFIDALVNDDPGPCSRHDCCFLWVDRMVESGLVEETRSFWVNCQDGYISSSYKRLTFKSKLCRLACSGSCTSICYSPPIPGFNNHTSDHQYVSNSFILTAYHTKMATDAAVFLSLRTAVFLSTVGSNNGRTLSVSGGIIFSCGFHGLAKNAMGMVRLGVSLSAVLSSAFGFRNKFDPYRAVTSTFLAQGKYLKRVTYVKPFEHCFKTSIYRSVTSTFLAQGKYLKRVTYVKPFEHCFDATGVRRTRVGPAAVPEIDLPLGGVDCHIILLGVLIYFAFLNLRNYIFRGFR